MRILVVEDDEICAELLHAQLRCLPFVQSRLEVAGTLADALAHLRAERFGVVVADLNLPDSAGLATVEALADAGDHLILVLTGDDTPALRAAVLEQGAYDFLHKGSVAAAALERVVRLAWIHARTFSSLRESEERLRYVIKLSTDFFWETDIHHRVIKIDHGVERHPVVNPAQVGKARWDLPSTRPDAAGWAAHRATMDAHLPFRDFEIARVDARGVERHRSISGEPVFDAHGAFRGYRGVGRDITAQKRAEEELHRFRLAMDNSADIILLVDGESLRYVDANATACRILGYSRDELLALGPADILPVSRDEIARTYAELIKDPKPSGMTSHYLCKDGSRLPFESTRHVLRSSKGWIVAAISRDIRERIASEAALRESEARFRSLAALSSDWYWEQDSEFRLTYMSSMEKTGLDASAYLGRKRWEQPALNLSEADWARHRAQLERREPFRDFEIQRPGRGGATVWLSLSGEPMFDGDGRFTGYRGSGRNITARKQSERQVIELERRYAALGAANEAVLRARSPREVFERACDAAVSAGGFQLVTVFAYDAASGGLTREAASGSAAALVKHLVPKIDASQPGGGGVLGHASRTGQPAIVNDYATDPRTRGRRDAGPDYRVGSAAGFPLHAGGEVVAVLGLQHAERNAFTDELTVLLQRLADNISFALENFRREERRVEAEAALQQSEAWFRQTFELAGSGIAHVAMDGRFLRVNRRLCEILGYAESELVGRSVKDISHPEDRDVTDGQRARMHAGGLESVQAEKRYLRRDGATVWVDLTVALARDAQGAPLYEISIIEDITERKAAEAALRESEARFRALTELSSDWYWEQDAELRFVSTAGASDARGGITPQAHVGLRRWELPRTEIVGQSWDEHRRVLERHEPFHDVVLRREAANGEVHYVSVDGRPVFGPQGEFAGYHGVAKDVTNRIAAELALRESEARFRSLIELSADFYWETDAEHRVLRTTHGVNHRPINANQVGKKRWELHSTRPDAAGWAAHRAIVEAHEPFLDFELARIDAEGMERHLSISGAPVFDAAGRFTGYRGVGKEITRRKREEALLRLEHEVTRCLAEAESAGAALRQVMRAICETQNWECGRYFGWDERTAALSLQEFWHVPNAALEAFIVKSRALSYQPGVGLIGQAYQSAEPLWVIDLAKDPRVKAGLALDANMHGAFLFAATAAGKPIGVFVFHSRRVREPDNRLLAAVRVIGSQVGQLVQRRHAESQRHEIELQFRRTFELVGTGLAHIGLDRRFIRVNRRLCEIFGYAEAELLGRTAKEFSHPDDLDVINEQRPRLYAGEIDAVRGEKRYLRKDGSVVWLAFTLAVERDAHGKAIYEITAYDDVTERKRAEQRQAAHLRYQRKIARFGRAALGGREPAEMIDEAMQIVLEGLRADAVAYLEPGVGERQVVLRAVVGLPQTPEATLAQYRAGGALAAALERGEGVVVDEKAPHGEPLPYAWATSLKSTALHPVRAGAGVCGVLCAASRRAGAFGAEETRFLDSAASVLSAALGRIESENRLAYLAQFDPLTGLPNRTLLADRFSQIIVQAKRRGSPLAVLFIDLDEFKMVNDTLGHAGGDALLKEVAVRLQSTVRSGDTVARISGDEFAIVLADLARPDDAALVAQKVIDRLASAVEIHGKEVFVTASVGIAAFPADGPDAEALLGAADAAMYRAKQSGRNAYQFFTAEINQRSRARSHMGSELRRALEREEFALVYQPKYDLDSRRPKGAEALLRWKHPERGTVSPAEFIPVLEETGLIVAVGEWVIRRACEDLKAWRAAGLSVGPVSINLSARQFRLPDLDARIKSLVTSAGVDPGLIELEITESQLMQDADHAIRVMRALCDAGMRIAIDDFGTGYSSLAYLTRFPLGSLKIDRSFVKNMLGDAGDATIVRTIIEMAHSLRFTVVAEGVETEDQASFLRLLRCEQAQGFLFARPMPAQDFARVYAA